MAFERSHGKARPTLVRASDLQPAEAAAKPTGQRDQHGHFAAGNSVGVAARFVHTIRKALGTKAAPGEAGTAARDGRRIYSHTLPSLPSQAPAVQTALSLHARHVALFNFYSMKAEAAGLASDEGIKFQKIADEQSKRAERCLVTTLDAARIFAGVEKDRDDPHAALFAIAAEEKAKGHV